MGAFLHQFGQVDLAPADLAVLLLVAGLFEEGEVAGFGRGLAVGELEGVLVGNFFEGRVLGVSGDDNSDFVLLG